MQEEEDSKVDPRMELLQCDWFSHKRCLDIGCNTGDLTVAIAREFHPKAIVGIDIDERLIQKASHRLLARLKFELDNWERSTRQIYQGWPSPYPSNVDFVQGNYLEMSSPIVDEQRYDVITCFSTTKWIHLNWGDEGIKLLFKRVCSQLVSGGLFLLEYQGWERYSKKRSLTPEIRKNYEEIKLKPEQFLEYLTGGVLGAGDFQLLHSLELTEDMKKKVPTAFHRKIYVLQKIEHGLKGCTLP